MINHPTEQVLQDYAMGQMNADIEISGHVQSCAKCREAISVYRQLFTVIAEQPKAVFEFDLESEILPLISVPYEVRRSNKTIFYISFGFAFVLLAILSYLSRSYLLNIFTGLSTLMIYGLVTGAIVVTVWQISLAYKKYQKQIALLNFN